MSLILATSMSLHSMESELLLLLPHLKFAIAPANHVHVVREGTAFLLRDSAVIVKSPPCPTFKTFVLSSVTLELLHSKLTSLNVYCHPPANTKTRKSMPFLSFSQRA